MLTGKIKNTLIHFKFWNFNEMSLLICTLNYVYNILLVLFRKSLDENWMWELLIIKIVNRFLKVFYIFKKSILLVILLKK